MKKIGIVHGRFQPLHLGHFYDYIMKAWEKCDHLIIGITNSDPMLTLKSTVNTERHKEKNNPLTYYERYTIIKNCMISEGIDINNFDIVPFPINLEKLLYNYVPKNATHYITIFDDWGRDKLKKLKSQNFNVVVLFEKPQYEKLISSTLVRELIATNGDWEILVPSSVAKDVKENGYDVRIKQQYFKEDE